MRCILAGPEALTVISDLIVVDAHEDIAWNVLNYGRDYTRSVCETRALETGSESVLHSGQALLGWPQWLEGRVAIAFATLFAAPLRWRLGPWERLCYADQPAAERIMRASIEVYRRMFKAHPERFAPVEGRKQLDELLAGWQGNPPPRPRLGLVLLMEGADAIGRPEQVASWSQAGVRIIGPAWAGTRYCGGTGEPGPLSADGRELLECMAEQGLILDLSHMAESAAVEAAERYQGTLIASHANPRALLAGSDKPDRHLSDALIQRIAERQGVIGVVVFNKFLRGDWNLGDPRRLVGIEQVETHIDYICQLTGSADFAGIGSDFDGAFGLEAIPTGLDSIADLELIGVALERRGYSQDAVRAIMGDNWLRILKAALPEG
jgi:membrane dipeptidase